MLLDRLQLGASGRPQLYLGECELHVSLESAQLEFAVPGGVKDECAERYENGEMRLTTHRLLFCDRDVAHAGRRSCALPLYAVKSYELDIDDDDDKDRSSRRWSTFGRAAAMMKKAPPTRVALVVCTKAKDSRPSPVVGTEAGGSSMREFEEDRCTVVFSTRDEAERFATQLGAALRDKAWAAAAPSSLNHHRRGQARGDGTATTTSSLAVGGSVSVSRPGASRETFSTSDAGISGIMRRQRLEGEQHGRAMDEAFTDLEKLMQHAKEMVDLAGRLRAEMMSAGSDEAMSESDNEQLSEWLLQMGMAMPVTRKGTSSAAQFHRELAREIADCVAAPLRSSRGRMLTMADVYCVVNRARGTELVSPDDVVTAAALWPSLGIPLATRKLKQSGALVVVQREGSRASAGSGVPSGAAEKQEEDAAMSRLLALPQLGDHAGRGLTIDAVASALDLAVLMATEYVGIAEEAGHLCRDDQDDDGLVHYYTNCFNDGLGIAALAPSLPNALSTQMV